MCNHPTHEPCVFFSKPEISVSIYGIIKITSQKHFFRWARRRESALPCPPHGTSGAKASRVPPGTTLCEARPASPPGAVPGAFLGHGFILSCPHCRGAWRR